MCIVFVPIVRRSKQGPRYARFWGCTKSPLLGGKICIGRMKPPTSWCRSPTWLGTPVVDFPIGFIFLTKCGAKKQLIPEIPKGLRGVMCSLRGKRHCEQCCWCGGPSVAWHHPQVVYVQLHNKLWPVSFASFSEGLDLTMLEREGVNNDFESLKFKDSEWLEEAVTLQRNLSNHERLEDEKSCPVAISENS